MESKCHSIFSYKINQLFNIYIILCILYVYKNFSTMLDKGLIKNNDNKKEREIWKHKLKKVGALNMKEKVYHWTFFRTSVLKELIAIVSSILWFHYFSSQFMIFGWLVWIIFCYIWGTVYISIHTCLHLPLFFLKDSFLEAKLLAQKVCTF